MDLNKLQRIIMAHKYLEYYALDGLIGVEVIWCGVILIKESGFEKVLHDVIFLSLIRYMLFQIRFLILLV